MKQEEFIKNPMVYGVYQNNHYLKLYGDLINAGNNNQKISIPKVDINIIKIELEEENHVWCCDKYLRPHRNLKIVLNCNPDENGFLYYLHNKEKNRKKMTIEEIEEKLGHKVDIVK